MVLRGIVVFVVLAVLAFFSFFWAHEDRLTWFDTKPALAAAAKYDATIVRDGFGVPHISGPRDADAAFGLAYAHAEDDFTTIQRALLSARHWRRNRGQFEGYRDISLVSTVAEYMHGLWHDVQIRVGPDHLPLAQLRHRLRLMAELFPPNPGFQLFAEDLEETSEK